MKLMVRIIVLVLPLLFMVGCDNAKPQPGQPPNETIPTPKSGPRPGGGGKPAATSQLSEPVADPYLALG